MYTQTKTPKNDPAGVEPEPTLEDAAGGSSQTPEADAVPEADTTPDAEPTPTPAEGEKQKNQPRPYVVFEKTGEDTFKLLRTGVLALRPDVAIESCIAADATGSYAAVTERSWHVLSTETETVTKRKWS